MTATKETAVAVVHEATSAATIVDLLRIAIEQNISVEGLERLQALHERVSDRAAAAEFAEALWRFQTTCPPISKTSTASIASRGGASYSYKYAELDHIARSVAPLLRSCGLSYTWDSEMTEAGLLRCTCTLRHVNGHAVPATFTCPVTSASGMNEQQKHAAALSYARRQSLIQVLGLTTADPDTDAGDPTTITQDQADDLAALIDDAGVNLPKFLRWAKVARLEDIRAQDYPAAVKAVERKKATS